MAGSVGVDGVEPLPQPVIRNPIGGQRLASLDPRSLKVVDRGRTYWGSAPGGGPEGGG